MEEVTIDSSASWKPVSTPIKQEIKSEDDSMSCSGTPGPPPKRLRSVDSTIASPMSITNPSTPGSYKPPTPAARPCTPSSTPGPKTPQPQTNPSIMTSSNNDAKFTAPSPAMHPASSQPQLLRQQSQSMTSPSPVTCNLTAAQGNFHPPLNSNFALSLEKLNLSFL